MNTTMQYKSTGIAVSTGAGAGQGDGFLVKGWMTVFNVPDLVGDVTVPGAFVDTIKAKPHPPLLWAHDTSLPPIGKVRNWSEVSNGVFFIAEIAPTTLGEDLKTLVKMGAVTGVSYGYNVKQEGIERRRGERLRRLEKVDVMELSLVNFPAHPDARLTGSEGKDLMIIGETEMLQACGVKIHPSMLIKYVDAMSRQAELVMKERHDRAALLREVDQSLSEMRTLT